MAPTKQTDHATKAKDNLLEIFKNQPNWASQLDVFSRQIQELEDMFFELIELRFLDDAVGEQLDGLGRILKVLRDGRDDVAYRLRLRVQILLILSSGTIPEIVAIVELLTDNAFAFTSFFPAAFVIIFADALGEDPDDIAAIVKSARLGGVGASIEFTLAADADTFTFASGDTPEVSAVQGFSNDGGTSGGKFAEAVGA